MRDDDGRRVRHPRVVVVIDTQHGRYLSTERAGHDRVPWTTLRPGSTEGITAAVQEMLVPRPSGVLR